jgi:tRNA threonylcarbamoyladenosine biosynthesis protein TsaE
MLQLCSDSPATTRAIAAAVASVVRSGDVIVLAGEMGAGKTVFAQGFGAALGVSEPITSPTYNLVHSHPAGRLTLHHADLYRLTTQHEVADLALGELAEADGVLLVEWGDVVAGVLGDHLLVRLDTPATGPGGLDGPDGSGDPDGRRLVVVSAVGRDWAPRWDRLTVALGAWAC